ncbi:MAG: PEP-utilizing enzyme, partial [Candidatus Gracilibacteria bacterium]
QNFFPEIKKNVYLQAKRLKSLSVRLRSIDYGKLSSRQLANKYLEFYAQFMKMRMYSSLPTAMEHLTNPWTELLTEVLSKKISDKTDLNKALSILTSPEKSSYLNEYQVAAAKLGIERERGKNIDLASEQLARDYAWIHYTFQGVPIGKKDVLNTIDEIKKTDPSLPAYVKASEERLSQLKLQKIELIKKCNLTVKEVELFEIGAEIVFIKYFRKGIFAEAYYSVEFLLAEIGKRVGCSRNDVTNMYVNEVLASLKIGSFPKGLIQQRLKKSGMWGHSGQSYPLSYKAEEVYKNSVIKEVAGTDIRGQVAFVGKVVGIVKIVNTPDDIAKFKDGEVLVSRSTNPSLIIAMQRASAFVTDLGGLTCHAAIVAREMKKPCVVGTKIATKVLKDGMVVEVDANNGVVRIIKN